MSDTPNQTTEPTEYNKPGPKPGPKPQYNNTPTYRAAKPAEVKVFYWGAPVEFGHPVQSEITAKTLIRSSPLGRKALAEKAVEIEINGQRKKLQEK